MSNIYIYIRNIYVGRNSDLSSKNQGRKLRQNIVYGRNSNAPEFEGHKITLCTYKYLTHYPTLKNLKVLQVRLVLNIDQLD